MVDLKLVVGGCSFTNYIWPTWADYASKHYTEFSRAGRVGADNATIARGVIDTAKENDIVVVMWTGFDRWNHYDKKWHYTGSVVSNMEYFANIFSPVERFTATMDYIRLVNLHAKQNGYTVYNFSAFPLFEGEMGKCNDVDKLLAIYNKYKDDISNNFLQRESLLEYQTRTKQLRKIKHSFDSNDMHPTPNCQYEYFEKFIAPELNIMIDNKVRDHVQYEEQRIINGDVSPWPEYDLLFMD